jgi:hypothetical protein
LQTFAQLENMACGLAIVIATCVGVNHGYGVPVAFAGEMGKATLPSAREITSPALPHQDFKE